MNYVKRINRNVKADRTIFMKDDQIVEDKKLKNHLSVREITVYINV